MTKSIESRGLRLWPGVVIVILQFLVRFGLPLVGTEFTPYGVLAGLAGGLAIVVWWLFFSRAPWLDRLGAVAVMILAMFTTSRFVHESIATGSMGMLLPVLATPILSLALVAWAAATRGLADRPRRAAMVATMLLACGSLVFIRTGGFTASFDNDLHWRWTKTPEERLLAQAGDEPIAPTPATAPSAAPAPTPAPAPAEVPEERLPAKAGDEPAALPLTPPAAKEIVEWPGFRGRDRDGVIRGVRIETDWSASPPVELWRRLIGPGWSSFAVHGDLVYTQEQRGDDEVVSCYNLTTGEPVWRHRDAVRFWESNGGAGPRGTPTVSNGRVYTLGATGILNVLDAANGTVVWSRNAGADTGASVPGWGFSSSPLVVNDIVIVAAGSRLVAYDITSGEPRWMENAKGASYTSPHLATIGGVQQVLLLTGAGLTSVAPADGTVLWEHAWPGAPIVQPALTADGDILITTHNGISGMGTRRLAVAQGSEGWVVEERWTSNGLKPYFNDFVVNDGHAFGFDGSILASIDLKDGQRKWKGGRYGNGQLVLLADQDLLLVLSEHGELALVKATPDQFTEVARLPAPVIEGKTWNHPVLVGDVLLVRNGEEMAAFRLFLERR
jgi:outer membrane protein assembly factor BamB